MRARIYALISAPRTDDDTADPARTNRPVAPRAFSPEQLATGLIWLSGYDPRTFDAVLDAAEPCPDDQDPDGSDEPEPVCGRCGEKIGIFLRLGLDWRHYKETCGADPVGQNRPGGTSFGRIELFDPGHAPVVIWRLP